MAPRRHIPASSEPKPPKPTALFNALLAGDETAAIELLRGPDASRMMRVGPAGFTVLFAAVIGGAAVEPGLCSALVAAGVDPEAYLQDDYGYNKDEGGELGQFLRDRCTDCPRFSSHLFEGATALSLAIGLLDDEAVEQLLEAGANPSEGLRALVSDGTPDSTRSGQGAPSPPCSPEDTNAGHLLCMLLAAGADCLLPPWQTLVEPFSRSMLGMLSHTWLGGVALAHMERQQAAGTLRLRSVVRLARLAMAAARWGHLPLLSHCIAGLRSRLDCSSRVRQPLGEAEWDEEEGGAAAVRLRDSSQLRDTPHDLLFDILCEAMDGTAAPTVVPLLLSCGLPLDLTARLRRGRSILSYAACHPAWYPHMPLLHQAGAPLAAGHLFEAIDDLNPGRVRAVLSCGCPPLDHGRQAQGGTSYTCPVHRTLAALVNLGRGTKNDMVQRAVEVLGVVMEAGYRPHVYHSAKLPCLPGVPLKLYGKLLDRLDPFNYYPGWLDRSKGVPIPFRHHPGPEEVGVSAEFYHVPRLSWRALVWEYLERAMAGTGAQLKAAGAPAPPPEMANNTVFQQFPWEFYLGDGVHMNMYGHRIMADLVVQFMHRMLDDVAREPLDADDEQEIQRPLPDPMLQGNYQSRSNTCMLGEQFKDLVTRHDDAWQWVNEGSEQRPKWGFVSTTPGSSLEFTISTNVAENSKNMTEVLLAVGFLNSYEHMGKFELSCIQGCQCNSTIQDGHYTVDQSSQLSMSHFGVTVADACVVKATVLNETSSGEHKVKLMGAVVGETTANGMFVIDNGPGAFGTNPMTWIGRLASLHD